jgi:alkylation response protein AidB-like acyl-CoA dehydrogenase
MLQRKLFDGGFAGLTYPAAYGGQGLSPEFQDVLNEEAVGYELPTLFNVSLGILGPTIVEFGTEEQKRRHIPALLRGDELWVQLLSEPASGSDLAGCVTRATRDGDQWVLNGSKIWSTGAHFPLCAVPGPLELVGCQAPGLDDVHRQAGAARH